MTFCEQSSDDSSIAGADLLIRAVHPRLWVKVNGGAGFRPASPAFNESGDGTGTSINLWEVLKSQGLPKTFVPASLKGKWSDHGFVEFPADLPRASSVKVVRMKLPENDAHAVLCGVSDEAKTALSRNSLIVSLGKPAIK